MKERPILFSAPMVRAILDGSKTQTRRVVKDLQGADYNDFASWNRPAHVLDAARKHGRFGFSGRIYDDGTIGSPFSIPCPYGKPADRLWVRETFGYVSPDEYERPRSECNIEYRADLPPGCTDLPGQWPVDECAGDPARPRWRPSIHMPRAASRILLEIISVRVERLQEISEADADAEGCERLDNERVQQDWKLCATCGGTRLHRALGPNGGVIEDVDCLDCDTYAKRFKHLWWSINGTESWAANPFVWVVTFKRVEA